MKRFSIPFCVAVLLWCTSVFSQYRVSGVITDYIAAGPSNNCLVRLLGQSPNTKTDSTRSDATGNYAFANVTGGVYEVVIADSRYERDSLLATINRDTVFSFTVFALTHTLVEGAIPDTLTKSGSPYFVPHNVQITKPLVIAAGAKIVLFQNTTLQFGDDVTAIGMPQDSIRFIGVFPGVETIPSFSYISLSNGSQSYSFAYCNFEHLAYVSPRFGVPKFLGFEHCKFSSMSSALLIETSHVLNFSNNVIINCAQGIMSMPEDELADSLVNISDNLFVCQGEALYLKIMSERAILRRNTILGSTTIDMQASSTKDTIASNIFNSLTFSNTSGKSVFFAYNDVDSSDGTPPVGIGSLATINTRGDSCDFYYNIKKKPLFADSTTGFLLKTSPCIAAGLGGENIGVYQGKGNGILREKQIQRAAQSTFKVLSARRRGLGTDLTVAFIHSSDLARFILTVYDLTGKRLSIHAQPIMKDASGGGSVTIRLSGNIATGNYVLSIGSGNNRILARFVVSE